MKADVVRVAVTGAAGQLAYSLLFRIASGEMFGADQPVALHLLDIEEAKAALQGVVMELDDCAFPLLSEVHAGSDAKALFDGVHWALLVGAKPRTKGMERKDLLRENARIFVNQGKALGEAAPKEAKVLVVGNPCNTNCLIAMQQAPRIPPENFHAMTRLDQNRAAAQLALRAARPVSSVKRVAIWGNHSATQVPDFVNALIEGKPALSVIHERQWLEGEFLDLVQRRGAAIIDARGKSSAASAANAVIDAVKALRTKTPEGEWFSSAVHSRGNPYGIDEDLFFSFPCRSSGDGRYQIVKDIEWDAFLKERIAITEQELIAEREEVRSLTR